MRRILRLSCALSLSIAAVAAHATDVAMCTDRGRITIELFDEQSPLHVANFLRYTDMGFYSGTAFHRVVPGFVIQGGGFDRRLRQKSVLDPIENESRNGLTNTRGTLAAARTSDPHSATAQFFINLSDNTALDASPRQWGYTVFGRVLEGMDVVDEIGALPTGPGGPLAGDVPDPLVAVTSVVRLDSALLEGLGDDPLTVIREQIATRAADDPALIEWITRYRAVCGPVEPSLLLTESRAAASAGLMARAAAALDEYFAIADQADPGYEAAVALRVTLGSSATTAATLDPATISGCIAPPDAPVIPDARSASMEDMVAAQGAVNTFMSRSESFLNCLSEALKRDNLSDEQRAVLVQAHNTTVGQMESAAEDFNEQVRIIRRRR